MAYCTWHILPVMCQSKDIKSKSPWIQRSKPIHSESTKNGFIFFLLCRYIVLIEAQLSLCQCYMESYEIVMDSPFLCTVSNKKINLKRLYPRDHLEFHGNNCMTLGSNWVILCFKVLENLEASRFHGCINW